ncbi:DUF3592 domain-containing protein [Streptomyces sp. NPDC059009]|uniref:DUF3592 domain-containing protein n=1 Tax=Streptomyces sp. NPDC059009 TaxID=3346694 RepID=UPI0036D0FA6F
MEFLFYAVPSVIAAVVVFSAVRLLQRQTEIRNAWNSGFTAEARCLRTYTTTQSHSNGNGHHHTSTTLHHVYEFATREGRPVRFEESNGPATTVEGDFVTVYYTAERPEAATAHPPRPAAMTANTIALLCVFGLILVFCFYFMATAHDMFSDDFGWDDPGTGGGYGDYGDYGDLSPDDLP